MQNNNMDLSMNPKQEQFCLARQRFVAYGGARGGGKSWAVRKKAVLLARRYDGIRILLLRRTYPELQENHIQILQIELHGEATYTDKKKVFSFPNKSTIKLGYCDNESDVLQYQGQEYDIIFIDEATQFTEYQYQTLTACLRGANDFPKRMYLTCNPGGVGHTWVKRLFIEKKYRNNENPDDYIFIPATVYDNAVLLEKDPEYVKMLDNLDEPLRMAWRDGNWDMLAGQYYNEFNRNIHTIDPIEIQPHWKIYRAIDYGLDCFACLWVAVDELSNYYVIREYAEPDKVISDGSREILSLYSEPITSTLAPPDLWARSQESGKSKADLFTENGLSLIKSNSNRGAGWLCIKELLQQQRLYIFNTCPELVECLTSLQRDGRNPNDCMTQPHEITHLPDALRYFCSYWIHAPVIKKEKTEADILSEMKDKLLKPKKLKRSYY